MSEMLLNIIANFMNEMLLNILADFIQSWKTSLKIFVQVLGWVGLLS